MHHYSRQQPTNPPAVSSIPPADSIRYHQQEGHEQPNEGQWEYNHFSEPYRPGGAGEGVVWWPDDTPQSAGIPYQYSSEQPMQAQDTARGYAQPHYPARDELAPPNARQPYAAAPPYHSSHHFPSPHGQPHSSLQQHYAFPLPTPASEPNQPYHPAHTPEVKFPYEPPPLPQASYFPPRTPALSAAIPLLPSTSSLPYSSAPTPPEDPTSTKRRRVSFAASDAAEPAPSPRPPTAETSTVASPKSARKSSVAATPAEEAAANIKIETGKSTTVEKAEKSCKACRARKVRCSRAWPKCARCKEKHLDCHYGNLIPIELVKNLNPDSRVAELEARIKTLELELELASVASQPPPNPSDSASVPAYSMPLASTLPAQIYSSLLSTRQSHLNSSPELQRAHILAVLQTVLDRVDVSKAGDGRFGPPTSTNVAGGASYPGAPVDATGKNEIEETEGLWEAFKALSEQDGLRAQNLRDMVQQEQIRWEEVTGNEEWRRWVVWGLLDAFWAQCSSCVPSFFSWRHPLRKLRLYVCLDSLSPSDHTAVAFFCAVGVRASLNLPLLAIDTEACGFFPSAPRNSEAGEPSLAIKRELQARAVRSLGLSLYDTLEIAHGEGTKGALEATVAACMVTMWNELVPRRSRSFVRAALGIYKDVLDSLAAGEGSIDVEKEKEGERMKVSMIFGLVLLVHDSTTAAYLSSSPLISSADLTTYFATVPLPAFPPSPSSSCPPTLTEDLATWLDIDRLEGAEHNQFVFGSLIIYKWLAACLRWVAEASCQKASAQPLDLTSLSSIFDALTSIHAVLQSLQHHLVNLSTAFAHPSCLSPGQGDTCESVHLRWCTRLDREADDVIWLLYRTVGERMLRDERRLSCSGEAYGGGGKGELEGGEQLRVQGEGGRLDVGWLQMCEARVRKGLKLVAFYFNFFTLSPDPHQAHHLAWSLELIPSWTFLATQRYIAPASLTGQSADESSSVPTGLRNKADELTPLELDWIENGLTEASKYHPVAERRLVEIRAYREGNEKRARESGEVSFPLRTSPLEPPNLAAASLRTSQEAQASDCSSVTADKGRAARLSFQEAMQVALKQSVPTWA
ncbi:hypothetical protein JCM11641_000753 [Rhodosporidiobolus odoratus]